MSRKNKKVKQPPRPVQESPRLRRRWWLLLLLPPLVVLLIELGLRIPGVGPGVYEPRRFYPDTGVPYIHASTIRGQVPIYDPQKSFSSIYDKAGDFRGYFGRDGSVSYRLNRFGMRGADVTSPKAANGYRVVCLGDSITFGEGVKEEDTYPVRLQKLLGASMTEKQVDVVNAGVQGYGLSESLLYYRLAPRAFKPDSVVLEFFLNDLMPFGETVRESDAFQQNLQLSALGRISRIWSVFERRGRADRLQRDYFDEIRRSFASPKWDEAVGDLLKMQRECQDQKIRFVTAIFPVLWDLDGAYPFADLHKKVSEACHGINVECVDLLDVLRGRPAESLWVHPTDQHPNETAHGLIAQKLSEVLLKPVH